MGCRDARISRISRGKRRSSFTGVFGIITNLARGDDFPRGIESFGRKSFSGTGSGMRRELESLGYDVLPVGECELNGLDLLEDRLRSFWSVNEASE
jgi:hypothetical protein